MVEAGGSRAATAYAIFHRYPEWSQAIRNYYWHLRYTSAYDLAKTRRQYRCIEREKKRLQAAGVDSELLRLLCRHMVNPRNQKAEERFWKKLFEATRSQPQKA